jgi:hypothetical protein
MGLVGLSVTILAFMIARRVALERGDSGVEFLDGFD